MAITILLKKTLFVLALLPFVACAQNQATESSLGRNSVAISPPQPDDCITSVAPGDHTFTCEGMTFQVVIDEMCIRVACGLIFDIHGASMSSKIMRANTELHLLAPSKGYLVVHPSAAPDGRGTWSFEASPPKMVNFMNRMIDVFQVDQSRIHVTGFSMGAAMTFWFLCNRNDILASTAVVTGSSADQVIAPNGDGKCIDAIDATWQPRVPILFMNGIHDPALSKAMAQARTDGIVARLGLTGGETIAGDGHYSRRRWTDGENMVFDFIEHDYTTPGRLGGHCMPGGEDVNSTTCTEGDIQLHWGKLTLQWFMEHPKL